MILFSYPVEQYDISISATGVPTAGEEYNLTCSVIVSAGTPTIQWQYSNGSNVTTGGDITVGSQETSGSVTTLTLTFNPLHTSHGGEYICRSVVQETVERTAMENVTVQSESVNCHCCTSKINSNFARLGLAQVHVLAVFEWGRGEGKGACPFCQWARLNYCDGTTHQLLWFGMYGLLYHKFLVRSPTHCYIMCVCVCVC